MDESGIPLSCWTSRTPAGGEHCRLVAMLLLEHSMENGCSKQMPEQPACLIHVRETPIDILRRGLLRRY